MEKLSKSQWFVLGRAYNAWLNHDPIITYRNGSYSISSNTCQALERLGYLSGTGLRDTFYITPDGIRRWNQGNGGEKKLKETDPQAAIDAWNRKVSGRKR